ncbi:hypothetical protein UA32_11715 [Photobacterium angustum]|uniref:Uncharacterized protein n=1 Tax=Photobacterium angustum TaxID=661 RepID=A0ABX5H1A9_PHOAN|nr:hypothetical protein [Photobacterium angustum]KJG37630.1 hypothetical protein UA32_11715 [Photobacterium angustum]PSX07084.1 hypothetical protein C0W27_16065 [Photobacterium angustum]
MSNFNNPQYSSDEQENVDKSTSNKKSTQHNSIFHKISILTTKISPFLNVVFLIAVVFLYMKQEDLKDSLLYAHSLIEKNDTKLAVIAFEPTVEAWNEIDPTGQSVRKILDKTIKAYNNAGYIIIDSQSVIGGTGNARFIDLMPETIKGN